MVTYEVYYELVDSWLPLEAATLQEAREEVIHEYANDGLRQIRQRLWVLYDDSRHLVDTTYEDNWPD